MNNTYGIVKPSVMDPTKDVEIWYRYTPNRTNTEQTFNVFNKVANEDVSTMLTIAKIDDSIEDESDKSLPGMYNLSLPASIFGAVGFYTVYIKPKEIKCTIKDIGALASYPDVRGIVIDLGEIDGDNRTLFRSDNLAGYRVEYYDITPNGGSSERQEYYRLVTSSGLCEPVSQNLTSSNTNSNGYRYNESATLAFLTVTPSTSPSFKGSQKPYIGNPEQEIRLINTKFDPVCLEIEICKNDFDTLTTVLTGNQIRSLDNGLLTTYNDNGEIFNQYEFYTLKDNYTTNDKFDVKKNRQGNIDFSANYSDIINN